MKIEVGKVYEAQEEKVGINTGDKVYIQSIDGNFVHFRKSGDPVKFKWTFEIFKEVFYPVVEPVGALKIEVGKKYRVLKNQGGHKKGDTLEVSYIDEEDGGRVDFLVNGNKSDFDSRVWLEKMDLEEITTSIKPAHYDTAIDTIAFAKANFSREQVEGFMRINAVKYIQRYEAKNGVDDVRKAVVYLNMLIEHLEEEGK